jgi:hypothetical protein
MTRMPRCLDCHHDYAAHHLSGAALGVFRCRAAGCDCIAYIARTTDLARIAA